MSKRDRRDSDGRDRDRRDYDRRDSQPDDDQHRRTGEGEAQEGDSLAALKAILSKVATLLKPLNLSAEESIRLVEQLYGSVLDMDVALAGESDDTRKSFTRAYIQRTNIRREGDRLVVEYPTAEELSAAPAQSPETAPAEAQDAETALAAEAARPADIPRAPQGPRPPHTSAPEATPEE
jgi:hypothetical protein